MATAVFAPSTTLSLEEPAIRATDGSSAIHLFSASSNVGEIGGSSIASIVPPESLIAIDGSGNPGEEFAFDADWSAVGRGAGTLEAPWCMLSDRLHGPQTQSRSVISFPWGSRRIMRYINPHFAHFQSRPLPSLRTAGDAWTTAAPFEVRHFFAQSFPVSSCEYAIFHEGARLVRVDTRRDNDATLRVPVEADIMIETSSWVSVVLTAFKVTSFYPLHPRTL